MSAPEALGHLSLEAQMAELGTAARTAGKALGRATPESRTAALKAAASALRAESGSVLAANAKDMEAARARGISAAMRDRLELTPDRIEAMARGVEDVADMDDPVGQVIAKWTRPNGLEINRVRIPLGVIGVIYESRPNVTADAGALCLKAGNAAILRGGSESFHSSAAIHRCLAHGLKIAGLPETAIQMLPTTDRAAVGLMLTMTDHIDVIVPRGGRSLVERVQAEARVPVFAHLEGVCHIFVHRNADKAMATEIAVNAKMRRTGICGSAETLLIDQPVVQSHLPGIVDALIAEGCEIRGDEQTQAMDSRVIPAEEGDWPKEFLGPIIAVRVVDGVEQALAHIQRYGSQHTESIVTDNESAATSFLAGCDSAIVMHNASTQFADGAEFGMGAEIGISTGRMHARGPVGVEQLTTFKYVVRGTGQTRP